MIWVLAVLLAVVLAIGWSALRHQQREQYLRDNPAARLAFAQLLPGGSKDSPKHETTSLVGEYGLLVHLGGDRALGRGQVDRGVRISRVAGQTTPEAVVWTASSPAADLAGVRESSYPDLGLRELDEHPGYELMRRLRPETNDEFDRAGPEGYGTAALVARFSELPRLTRLAVAAGLALAVVLVYLAVSAALGTPQ